MNQRYQDDCDVRINTIIRHISDENNAPLFHDFTQHVYRSLSLEDLTELSTDIAAHTATSLFTHYETQPSLEAPFISIDTPEFLREYYSRSRVTVSVISQDMPFLVDSLTIALKRMGFTIYRTIHPQLRAERNAQGALTSLHDVRSQQGAAESCIYFELSPLPEDISKKDIEKTLRLSLDFVRYSVEDWRVMMAKAREVNTHVITANKAISSDDIEEASAFFDWLLDNNFIFLGFVEYDFHTKEGEEFFAPVKNSALGIFKVKESDLLHRGLASLPPEVRHFALQSEPVEITKSNRRSLVHRDVPMDYIGVKRYDAAGNVIGESRFIGLFTSPVYYQETTSIPYIRRKVQRVMDAAGFDPAGHSGKALKAALEFFPRDELFQISLEDLLEISLGIISLEERPDMRVFFRRDRFERFISCFVFMPRDRYNTYVRIEVGKTLERHLNGKINIFYTQLTDSALARVNYIIQTTPGHIPDMDMQTLYEELQFIVNYWVDALRDQLQDTLGEQQGEMLFRQFGEAFPRNYVNSTPVTAAINDIEHLQHVVANQQPAFYLFITGKKKNWHLKMYGFEEEIALSDILPMLENLGFKVRDVVPHRVEPSIEKQKHRLLVRDFSLIPQSPDSHDFETVKPLVEHILSEVWERKVENDGLNALSVASALNSRQITLVRTYARYAKQADLGYSDRYVTEALCKHAAITSLIVGLFEHRFDPSLEENRAANVAGLYTDIMDALSSVDNLAEDRILRFFADTVQATLRTNYFQVADNHTPKTYLSIKLDSSTVPGLPLPRPFREIFVYSMMTEGIHLRGGMVARGGLRWSDRREDFRTEVLGLMKAQMVKNTVIVPTGSKGGFVVKSSYDASDREARMQAGIASYRQFLSGLLDITDNRVEGGLVTPDATVRYDDDDPYLVVAADKGTATFSDTANQVAAEYGFWLDDAFASGGSAGYDHKEMGITARGAWVAVERHFLELGIDVAKQDFTVVGIGDMSGDVFGNGMLLSEHIQLVAAFNHLHIFLDPTPDTKKSYQERTRLYEEARGSWDRYDTSLISRGGGVFSRSAKTIPLTPEIKTLLDTEKDEVTPNEVIRLILKAEVDLLWNGGIGTYVKARTESHEAAGDPGNNAVRVNADELRCKVIGEGGNLGMTQLGRIEYARAGGRLNTDAIDNSAGVDCSDHEVNIKIAMHEVMESGLLSLEDRNTLLEAMEDDVASLVLHDNQQQNQALSITRHRSADLIELHAQFIRALEENGLLDRMVEYLPTDKQLNALKAEGQGLTRPELAVLLSYSKMALYGELAASKLVSDDIYTKDLVEYFPKAMRERYREAILVHPLRREIVATRLTNEIVNHAGITYIFSIAQDTGHAVCNIVRAYTVMREIFKMDTLWYDIETLTGSVNTDTQIALFTQLTQFMERMTIWFLTNSEQPLCMDTLVDAYSERIAGYIHQMDQFVSRSISDARDAMVLKWTEQNVPEPIAVQVANLDYLISACDIAMIDQLTPQSISVIGSLYYELGARLQLSWLRLFVSDFPTENHWDRLAIRNAISELYEEQRRLTLSVVEELCDDLECSATIDRWVERNKEDIERFKRLIHEIKSSEQHDLAMVIVAMRQLTSIKATTTLRGSDIDDG